VHGLLLLDVSLVNVCRLRNACLHKKSPDANKRLQSTESLRQRSRLTPKLREAPGCKIVYGIESNLRMRAMMAMVRGNGCPLDPPV
jgi:hypothetical protein